jgi:serine/threonine protein kinase
MDLLLHFTVTSTDGGATCKQSATMVLERDGLRYFGKVVKPSESASQIVHMTRLYASLAADARAHFARPVGLYTLNGGAVVVTELIVGLDLYDYVATRGPWARGDEQLRALTRALLAALEAMHDHGLMHGDVKPENIMLELDADGGVARACLVDFGFCLPFHGAESELVCGSVGYSPPEVLRREKSRFSPLVDVWGLGVTLLVLATGVNPFLRVVRDEVDEPGSRLLVLKPVPFSEAFLRRYHARCSAGFRSFIAALLVRQSERPTVAAALAHPWLCVPVARPCLCLVPCAVPVATETGTAWRRGTSGMCDSAAATV